MQDARYKIQDILVSIGNALHCFQPLKIATAHGNVEPNTNSSAASTGCTRSATRNKLMSSIKLRTNQDGQGAYLL